MEDAIIRQKYEAMLIDLKEDYETYSAELAHLIKLKKAAQFGDDPDEVCEYDEKIKWHQTMLKEVKTAIGNIEKCLRKGQPPCKS